MDWTSASWDNLYILLFYSNTSFHWRLSFRVYVVMHAGVPNSIPLCLTLIVMVFSIYDQHVLGIYILSYMLVSPVDSKLSLKKDESLCFFMKIITCIMHLLSIWRKVKYSKWERINLLNINIWLISWAFEKGYVFNNNNNIILSCNCEFIPKHNIQIYF